MTTAKNTNKPLSDLDKQVLPLEGEVSPKEARQKGETFANQIKARMKAKGAKLK